MKDLVIYVRETTQLRMVVSKMKTIVVVFLTFLNLLAMVFRLVVKTGVAIYRIAANLSLRASSGGKRQQIQHGNDHDHKVNKDSSCCFFEYDQSFGHD